jgi:hypothetical protein
MIIMNLKEHTNIFDNIRNAMSDYWYGSWPRVEKIFEDMTGAKLFSDDKHEIYVIFENEEQEILFLLKWS